ncbi:Hypothetical predicted protein [Mytilus galloprovincialis]|uniref:Uncharacterized protein n=1 Tax=Mytilus galloprovincialis TaxID=29158 RepID=A0A8B6CNA2_MYTGA|nr:Hypothetical predicted protein [Mytilus galloprovincialis]
MASTHQGKNMNTRYVNIVWSIKGYPQFKVKLHTEIPLNVDYKEGSRFDPFAMRVMMPVLDNIPHHLHDAVTKESSVRHSRRQTVREIAGRQVGRVPANLCRAFRILNDRNLVTDIACCYHGTCGPTTNPFSGQRYRHNFSYNRQRDIEGGGAELSYTFTLKTCNAKFEDAMHVLEEHVGINSLDNKLYA